MKIGIIGSTGLIGSRIKELLSSTHQFDEYNSSIGADITDKNSLATLAASDAELVLLLAAKTDVDSCELDREKGDAGDAWKINVVGAQNVASLCAETQKKLVYVSTDFVFDGEKPEGQAYTEDDVPSPVNWYGYTKWHGEEAVKNSGVEYIIVRPAYPYRAAFEKKNDFMRAIKARMENNQPVAAVSDHLFCPVFIDDFVHAIDVLISSDKTGIFHTVGSQTLSPFDAAKMIALNFGLDQSQISSASRADYFAGKAKRPFNLSLKNDKINALGVEMRGFEEGLQEVKRQITNSQ